MKPNLAPAYKRVGIAGGASVLLSIILVWSLWDGGVSAADYQQEKDRYKKRTGSYLLSDLVRDYESAINDNQQKISELKEIMGMSPRYPLSSQRVIVALTSPIYCVFYIKNYS